MAHLTPTAERLELALDTELRRMQNEWFFKWHFIGRSGPVEIDAFDGRTLQYNLVAFSGTAQLVFWETIERYLRQKMAAVFDGLEEELPRYPARLRHTIVDQAVPIIRRFADAIRQEAIEKDRVLRGNGFELPTPYDRGKWVGARAACRSQVLMSKNGTAPAYCKASGLGIRYARGWHGVPYPAVWET